ncbi:hypothetical protein DMA11_16040 [Marinilabiliaceae bacterium JC017]|nr:hypothetical protein DMA11_16040 [Marinilabiliaceae bacterium JC017]
MLQKDILGFPRHQLCHKLASWIFPGTNFVAKKQPGFSQIQLKCVKACVLSGLLKSWRPGRDADTSKWGLIGRMSKRGVAVKCYSEKRNNEGPR